MPKLLGVHNSDIFVWVNFLSANSLKIYFNVLIHRLAYVADNHVYNWSEIIKWCKIDILLLLGSDSALNTGHFTYAPYENKVVFA